MTNTVKTFLWVLILVLALVAAWGFLRNKDDGRAVPRQVAPVAGTAPAVPGARFTPLTGSGLRFDGYYRTEISQQVYLMRFFERGNVVLVNGPQSNEESLPPYLRADAESFPERGIHNVSVVQRNDSILFRTFPSKGEISYGGVLLGGDTLRLLKHSHINGRKALLDHVFVPDASS
jgi:hypothetical protein